MAASHHASLIVLRRAATLIIGYFVLWHFARIAEVANSASAFYPSAGVLVFFIYRWGVAYLPAAVAAMLLVDISQSFGAGWAFSSMHLLRQLAIYGGLALLARRMRWLEFPMRSLPAALRLTAFCVGASLLSALVASAIFWHFLPELRTQLAFIMLGFWLGDFSGLLMFLGGASVTLSIARSSPLLARREADSPGLWRLGLSTLAVVLLMVALIASELLKGYSYLVLLPVIAGAIAYGMNFGIAAAILANLSAVATYIVLAANQMDLIQVQSLCAVVMMNGMLLGAAIDDRRSARFDAWHDPLTGLLNRRALFEQGEILLARAQRTHSGVAAIAGDLDFFKLVNDRWGHDAGDKLLIAVAGSCRAVIRRGDLAARMGGEEFLLLIESQDLGAAVGVAERLRQLVMTHRRGGTADAATASFGVAWLPATMGSLEELLLEADRLLYVAKESGRNRVVSTAPA